jgi:hypothetical protein
MTTMVGLKAEKTRHNFWMDFGRCFRPVHGYPSTVGAPPIQREPLHRNLIRHIAKHYASPKVDQL